MRPTGMELIRGVRTLLAAEILPEIAAPHLRAQVGLAIGMLDSAAAELEDAPAALAEERPRTAALAAEALPLLRRAGADAALVAEMAELASNTAALSGGMRSIYEQSARLLDLLDRLSAFVDERAESGDAEIEALGRRVDGELRAVVARRARWIGGGP